MQILLAKLVWHFDMELSDKQTTWVQDLRVYGLWDKGPLMIRVKEAER